MNGTVDCNVIVFFPLKRSSKMGLDPPMKQFLSVRRETEVHLSPSTGRQSQQRLFHSIWRWFPCSAMLRWHVHKIYFFKNPVLIFGHVVLIFGLSDEMWVCCNNVRTFTTDRKRPYGCISIELGCPRRFSKHQEGNETQWNGKASDSSHRRVLSILGQQQNSSSNSNRWSVLCTGKFV